MRGPPASLLFASWPWPRHTWMLVATYGYDSILAESFAGQTVGLPTRTRNGSSHWQPHRQSPGVCRALYRACEAHQHQRQTLYRCHSGAGVAGMDTKSLDALMPGQIL